MSEESRNACRYLKKRRRKYRVIPLTFQHSVRISIKCRGNAKRYDFAMKRKILLNMTPYLGTHRQTYQRSNTTHAHQKHPTSQRNTRTQFKRRINDTTMTKSKTWKNTDYRGPPHHHVGLATPSKRTDPTDQLTSQRPSPQQPTNQPTKRTNDQFTRRKTIDQSNKQTNSQ